MSSARTYVLYAITVPMMRLTAHRPAIRNPVAAIDTVTINPTFHLTENRRMSRGCICLHPLVVNAPIRNEEGVTEVVAEEVRLGYGESAQTYGCGSEYHRHDECE